MENRKYNFKRALEQPIWVQKITDIFSFNNPHKLSLFIYCGVLYFLFVQMLNPLLLFLPWGVRYVLIYGSLSLKGGQIFSDLKIDGKTFIVYIYDRLSEFIQFGIYDEGYFYKGKFYKRKQEKEYLDEIEK